MKATKTDFDKELCTNPKAKNQGRILRCEAAEGGGRQFVFSKGGVTQGGGSKGGGGERI